MGTEKYDAALRLLLSKQEASRALPVDVDVSIRLERPMSPAQAGQLVKLGVETADTRRRVIFAKLPCSHLPEVAAQPWVQQISLSQVMQPKPKKE